MDNTIGKLIESTNGSIGFGGFEFGYIFVSAQRRRGEMEEIMNQDYMKTKPILPLVLSMSLPMVLSMLVNSLYNIVDSFFVARISENAMNALSLVFPIQNLITAIAVGFGVGMNAVIAFYLGTEDHKKAEDSMAQGLLLSAIHGLILMIVCVVFIPKD